MLAGRLAAVPTAGLAGDAADATGAGGTAAAGLPALAALPLAPFGPFPGGAGLDFTAAAGAPEASGFCSPAPVEAFAGPSARSREEGPNAADTVELLREKPFSAVLGR